MNLCLSAGLWIGIGVLLVLVIILAVFLAVVPVAVWIKAMVSGAHIPAKNLVAMKLRNKIKKGAINERLLHKCN